MQVSAKPEPTERAMIRFPFFKPRPNPVAGLYGDIVAASRAPVAYREFGVADDFEGRFERLTLIATLVLRRMRAIGGNAHDAAQQLVDHLFADLDDGLRRSGVGDLSVGKKMKKLAQGFYGRAEAYTAALEASETDLRDALSRNLFSGRIAAQDVAPGLIREIMALVERLDAASLETLLAGSVLHPHYLTANPA
jgi:cytochrome b pre-mRNA-processing protein 3